MPLTGPDSAAGTRSPRRFYLVTCSGFPNYGDELIAANWLRELAWRAPDADVWVDTHSPGLASVLLDGLHPRARFVDTVWRLCWAAPTDDPWEVAAWVGHAVADIGRAPRWAAATELLHNVDVVHLVGGGYLHGKEWPRHVGLLAAALAANRRCGARTAMTGQGVAPLVEGSAALFGELVDQFDVADFRDQTSQRLLRDAGASRAGYSCDDAFLGLGSNPEPERAAPEFILCAQSDMLTVERSLLAGLILRTLRDWKVDPANLGIVECIPGVDRDIFALLEHQLAGARFYPFTEVWRDGLPVARGQTWLSTRFHPHLVAAALGAKGAAIPVSPDYYLTKHSSLIEQGSGWTLADDLEVPPVPTGSGFPADVVRGLHAEKLRLAEQIYGPPVASTGPNPRPRLWDRARRPR
ncbi:MAG TPA: polysaccharide pyruvyl transferase family protein [Pseudonocardia sp.]|jgi:polysaccharide pyruvyl transferase WcaK-like protein